jgi:hypothetical protein
MQLYGSVLFACFARGRGSSYDPRIVEKEMSLFIKGLPLTLTSMQLKMMFIVLIL